MRLRTVEKWFKLYNNILFIVALVIIGIYLLTYFFKDSIYSKNGFVDPDEIKAKTASIPPAPDKVCESPADTGFVCKNFAACCPLNSPNCICQSPNTQKCQQKYKDCLAGRLFSPASMDFLGRDNLPEICKKFADGCCAAAPATSGAAQPKQGAKPDLSNPANSICQIDGYKKPDLAQFCGQICSDTTGCDYYQTDGVLGSCSLFKGQPISVEKGAAASPVSNYQLFMAQRNANTTGSKEGFMADSTGLAAQFCMSGAVSKCDPKSPSRDCLCSHSVIRDCQRMNSECLKSGIIAQTCNRQFGACCGILDTNDPTKQASMTTNKPKFGSGLPDKLVCRAPGSKSLDECKRACLNHDQCRFIDSNMVTGSSGSSAPYCYLFSGEPSGTAKVMLSKQTGADTIYMKQLGNPDELAANAALEKK